MTQDFAKPTTTRKPGASKKPKKKPAKKPAAGKKPVKKNTQTPPTEPKSKTTIVVSLLLLSTAFLYGLYFLQSVPPTHIEPTSVTGNKSNAKSLSEQNEPAEKRFNFYDILPDTKITSQKVDEYTFKEKSSGSDFYYVIQTGSFRSAKDAEKQKATIAFQGLKANIKTATNKNGKIWHRVSTGPYNNRSTMNNALDKLVAINIQPLVKKIKKVEKDK